ncbi:MAG: HAMP domain-containing protein, partial [Spirochaetales bacterium]|nr:HAMP domain-containing protein [Spirochaetales bacterium]
MGKKGNPGGNREKRIKSDSNGKTGEKTAAKITKAKSGIKYPLVLKLIGITSIIIIVSITAVTALASVFFTDDSRARAEENNLTLSELVAFQVESEIRSQHSAALSLFDMLRESAGNRTLEQITITNYFDRNALTACIEVPGEKQILSPKFFLANELEPGLVRTFLEMNGPLMDRARAGETLLVNASPVFGVPTAALMFPFRDFGTANMMAIVFSTENLQSIVQTGAQTSSWVVGYDGMLIAHSDFGLVRLGASFADNPVVKEMIASTMNNGQIRYRGEDGVGYAGAFHKVSLGQFGVGTAVPTAVVYRAALALARQNLYITGIVLLFSFLAVWFFSRTVSRPVLKLVDASRLIENGQFELDISPTTRDELGLLTKSFVHMGKGLADRERLKDTFGKFVNEQIAEQVLKGELKLGGTRRTATIFFSDIRSFTAISEKLAPEAVVEFLNEYMSRMVECVDKTGGVVDKFIGDAIMAVWGAPVSAGSPAEDALNAIKAMLMMRRSLYEFNKGRGSDDKPLIRIGCGVNTGPCIAGQIGSEKRMEYTVIGDAVNLA